MADLIRNLSGIQKILVGLSLAVIITVITSPWTGSRPVAPTATVIPTPPATSSPTATPPPTLAPARSIGVGEQSAPPALSATSPLTGSLPIYTYQVVNTFPHDRDAFTQGLIFHDGIFYEGTGLNGRSTLRKVEPETGQVLQIHQLAPEFFGEGLTLFDDRLIQLTWKSQRGFVYDKDSFELLREFTYPTEGWGLTHDGQRLIMSDGSATLYFWDPLTFAEIGRVQVTGPNGPVVRLNELEYVNGEVFANIWQTDRIARIDPNTGQVTGWILLDGLLGPADRSEPVDVLNGIAYDPAGQRLFVTGKFWPKLFEIKLLPQP